MPPTNRKKLSNFSFTYTVLFYVANRSRISGFNDCTSVFLQSEKHTRVTSTVSININGNSNIMIKYYYKDVDRLVYIKDTLM